MLEGLRGLMNWMETGNRLEKAAVGSFDKGNAVQGRTIRMESSFQGAGSIA